MTLTERLEILAALENDESTHEEYKKLCAASPAFFLNTACFIYEPRAKSNLTDLPFLLRGFQEKYVNLVAKTIAIEEDLLTDKTREMGVTWMILGVLLHHWLFSPRFTAIVSSITEEKIDKPEDPNCLFWKFDYLLSSMCWTKAGLLLYPEGYKKGRPYRTHMKLFNPANGSIINGEVMGPNLGRSGRARVIFPDEFAEAADPASAWAASSRTTNCRLPVFTPKGMNFAGRLANPAKGTKRTINRVTLHWLMDETKNRFDVYGDDGTIVASGNGAAPPEYNSAEFKIVYPWYELAKERLNYDPIKIAQELDVNYAESAEGLMYPQIRRSRYGDFAYNPNWPLYCSMDYGLGDATSLVWCQYNPELRRMVWIDAFEKAGRTIHWFIPFILGSDYFYLGDAEGGYSLLEQRMILEHDKFQGRYTDFFGDPSGKNRNQVTNTSVIQELAKYSIRVRTNDKARSHEVRHKSLQALLLRSDFDEDRCAGVIDALENSVLKPSGTKLTPVHDHYSHYRTACEYLAVNQPHGFSGTVVGKVAQAQAARGQEFEAAQNTILTNQQIINRALDVLAGRAPIGSLRQDQFFDTAQNTERRTITRDGNQLLMETPDGVIQTNINDPQALLKFLKEKEDQDRKNRELLARATAGTHGAFSGTGHRRSSNRASGGSLRYRGR